MQRYDEMVRQRIEREREEEERRRREAEAIRASQPPPTPPAPEPCPQYELDRYGVRRKLVAFRDQVWKVGTIQETKYGYEIHFDYDEVVESFTGEGSRNPPSRSRRCETLGVEWDQGYQTRIYAEIVITRCDHPFFRYEIGRTPPDHDEVSAWIDAKLVDTAMKQIAGDTLPLGLQRKSAQALGENGLWTLRDEGRAISLLLGRLASLVRRQLHSRWPDLV